jgi:hypothetical protein
MDNAYLAANLGTMEKLDKHLIELELLGSFTEEVPIPAIRGMMRGMKFEIARLQGEVIELTKALKEKVDDKTPEPKVDGK